MTFRPLNRNVLRSPIQQLSKWPISQLILLWLAVVSKGAQIDSLPESLPSSVTVPDFPEEAKLIGMSGSVALEVFIDPNGNVPRAHAIEGSPLFFSVSARAVSLWLFPKAEKSTGFRRSLVYIEFLGWNKSQIGNYSFAEMVFPDHRVSLYGDRTHGLHKAIDTRPRKCPVHGIWMVRCRVPIRYGDAVYIPSYVSRYNEAAKSFPNSNRYAYGGMRTEPESETIVLYCPKCRRAEEAWERQIYLDRSK
jgi:hypothetical protein